MLEIRENEGRDVFFDQIRNCVAGCRQKWKTMPRDIKMQYCTRAKEQMEETAVDNRKEPANKKKSKVDVIL